MQIIFAAFAAFEQINDRCSLCSFIGCSIRGFKNYVGLVGGSE